MLPFVVVVVVAAAAAAAAAVQRKLPLETVYLDIQNASDGWYFIQEFLNFLPSVLLSTFIPNFSFFLIGFV